MHRWLATFAGLLLTGIGFVGLVTPGLPGTVFFIGALFCFRRSCPFMEEWLLNNRFIGPTLRDWDSHRWISMRRKKLIIAMIWVFTLGSVWHLGKPFIAGSLLVLAGIGTYVILRTRTKPEGLPATGPADDHISHGVTSSDVLKADLDPLPRLDTPVQ